MYICEEIFCQRNQFSLASTQNLDLLWIFLHLIYSFLPAEANPEFIDICTIMDNGDKRKATETAEVSSDVVSKKPKMENSKVSLYF